MGFIPDIKRIMALLPKQRQNLLFSATFSNEIKKLADELLNKPKLIEVARRNTAAETVSQSAYKLPQEAKRSLLVHLVKSRNVWQVLCFVRTKHGASRLARQLEKEGLATSAIHGDKTQAARLEALSKFKDGKLQVLVATDVAARGLDIDDLPLVVNYELPHVPEDYIHRIGRTGRAGATGEAISFVAPEEEKYLAEIEKLLKKKVAIEVAQGFEPEREITIRREAATHEPRTRARAANGDARGRGHAGAANGARRDRDDAAHRPTNGDARRAEREAAYAKNPDQPIVRRIPAQHDVATLVQHRAHMHAARRAKPVPMLLQKRRSAAPQADSAGAAAQSREPEKV
jgi:ATP-dependent RNA helicase RhlE